MISVLALTAVILGAQLPPPPPPPMPAPRDPATVKKGTSTLKGHVFTIDGRPLRRAQIRVTGTDARDAVTTNSGLEGEWELPELPAGRYTVQATRGGYLPARYGERVYGQPATPVNVAAGATLDKIDLVMSRAGVVSGRVTDETGEAVAGVDMRAMQMQFFQGQKRLVPVATWPLHVTTDETGQYRLTGLPPGEYVIAGRLRDTWTSDEKEPQTLTYAPSYFPGTADPLEARTVKIAAGQEAGAIDFSLLPVRAARISGTAFASDGTPLARARIVLSQEIMGPSGGTVGFAGNALADESGAWSIREVAPGDYVIRASSEGGDRPAETAVLPVTVTGTDLEGLVVSADAGGLITGRLVTDAGEPLPATGPRVTISTGLTSMVSGAVRPALGKDDGIVGPDGAFSRKTPSGSVVLRVSGLPRGWTVKSIDVGGRDYSGFPIDVPAGQSVASVTVVVSSRLPSLTGRLLTADATPAAGIALLFPADPLRWIEAAANQRIARADGSGRYVFDAVRPGEYFLVAVDSMETWQMNDPDFLGPLRERASKLTIGSETVTLDLKVVRP